MISIIKRTCLFEYACFLQGLKPKVVKYFYEDLSGYSEYIDESYDGIKSNFKPVEMLGRYGGIPEKYMWPRLLFLRWIADLCRDKKPVTVAYTWRPFEYNKSVGGAPSSAHIDCCAVDLDFKDVKDRKRAHGTLKKIFNSPINLGMGIGVGNRRLHVDVLSKAWEKTGRTRTWEY